MTFIEKDCTINFQGKTFESGGAIVTENAIIAYPKFETETIGSKGVLNDLARKQNRCLSDSGFVADTSVLLFY
jgi:hypothetical protein